MGKIINTATWLEKKWKQARDSWASQKRVSPGNPQQQGFTWFPKTTAMRIALVVLLAVTYCDKRNEDRVYVTLWGFFLITSLRYGWLLLTKTPRPDLRRDWWHNPGIISVVACLFISYAGLNADRERMRNSQRGSSTTSETGEELDARLRRNFERAMGETTSGSSTPNYGRGSVRCRRCGSTGTITTVSGYTIVCPDCSGRGGRDANGGVPQAFPKYEQ